MIRESLIETPTHGRVLLRAPLAPPGRGLLVGFHGYAETADVQMARLQAIPGADAWTLLSVQALHRFYRGRSEQVVASWMTRQDRDTAIDDNRRYVDAAVEAAGPAAQVVYAGFSQGVAMAFRAAVHGRAACTGVIVVGGDVPPDLVADPAVRFPAVLLVRGSRDEWYSAAKFDADVLTLESRSADLHSLVVEGGHDWHAAASEAAGTFLSALHSA